MKERKDSVDLVHPDYDRYINMVNIVRDIFNGTDSIKKHIYQFDKESDESIKTRREKATVKNFVKRSTEAFVGMIFRKSIETTSLDDRMLDIIENIDKSNNLAQFARELTTNLVLDGKVFIGIDTDVNGEGEPYAVIYKREQVINWRINEAGLYTLIVIKEIVEEKYGKFGSEEIVQYRVFNENGNVDIYRETDNGFMIVETIETEYDYIPIVSCELADIPMLYDVAKLTIKHLNRTSIKDKYLDMCATPIPVLWDRDTSYEETNGIKPVAIIGADSGFVFSGTKEECDFEWRELSGSSIDKLQEDLRVIEDDITTGIIRAAVSDSTTIKTATQSFYEAAESANRVAVIAYEVETGLNKILKILADVGNIEISDEAKVIVNKDFNAVAGDGNTIRLLWEVYLQGGISTETFLDSLSKYEIIDIGSVRDEITRIEMDKFVLKPRISADKDNPTYSNMDNRTKSVLS